MKYVSPSVQKTAFNCSHCSALAHQFWWSLYAQQNSNEKPLPSPVGTSTIGPFILGREKNAHRDAKLCNVFVSSCFNCKKLSIWIYGKLVYLLRGEVPPANQDLPDDIRRDYDEASSILDLSPRGSAALIRLAIQKLCIELGKSGKNLNDDIGALVKDGLDPHIQEALDIVRVIGNNAVHPGQIDQYDEREVAESLFCFLNLIANKMISERKEIDEAFAALPESKRKAIEERDANN